MIRDEIRELLLREPFEPFRILTTVGEWYEIRNSALAALMKSAIFIAFPKSNRGVTIPFLHVATLEIMNGRTRPPSRRGKRG